MKLLEKRKTGYKIINLPEEVDSSNIDELEDALNRIAKTDYHKLIFNLRNVKIITSRCIGLIFRTLTVLYNFYNKKLKLCVNEDNDTVMMIFHSIQMNDYIDYYTSVEDAIYERNKMECLRVKILN